MLRKEGGDGGDHGDGEKSVDGDEKGSSNNDKEEEEKGGDGAKAHGKEGVEKAEGTPLTSWSCSEGGDKCHGAQHQNRAYVNLPFIWQGFSSRPSESQMWGFSLQTLESQMQQLEQEQFIMGEQFIRMVENLAQMVEKYQQW